MTSIQILQQLREHAEQKTHENGEVWGMVYLPNVGNTRSFAGHLSALKKAGLYRTMDDCFGEVFLGHEEDKPK